MLSQSLLGERGAGPGCCGLFGPVCLLETTPPFIYDRKGVSFRHPPHQSILGKQGISGTCQQHRLVSLAHLSSAPNSPSLPEPVTVSVQAGYCPPPKLPTPKCLSSGALAHVGGSSHLPFSGNIFPLQFPGDLERSLLRGQLSPPLAQVTGKLK